MCQLMSWARQRMQSGPRKLLLLKASVSKPDVRSASGSANSYQMKSESLCLMTSVYAMGFAGRVC